jgi:major vault protein
MDSPETASGVIRLKPSRGDNPVRAIGPETLRAIAAAGPELQVRLLQGLGLKSMLITDGRSPINLFNTANGLVNPLSLPIQE